MEECDKFAFEVTVLTTFVVVFCDPALTLAVCFFFADVDSTFFPDDDEDDFEDFFFELVFT